MPAVNIFQTLRERVMNSGGLLPHERRAMYWFQNYQGTLTSWQKSKPVKNQTFQSLQQEEFTKQLVGANKAWPGFFYCFLYDPKWKMELPYYDRFPFTLVLDVEKDRFTGLNFHYLDYYHRAALFDAMYPLRTSNLNNIRTKMAATYSILKNGSKYKAFKPCFKSYLIQHIRTPLMKVGANDWDVALFLPVEKFAKESKTTIWRESASKIK